MNRRLDNAQLESRVRGLVDLVKGGHRIEDSRVELKSEWPSDIARAAKQIAGMCNAARDEKVLWIIGLDETGRITGAEAAELSSWWPRVVSRFDSVAPSMTNHLVIPMDDGPLQVLEFETDRAPYVVKRPEGQDLEVPWREGARTRSANRAELLRLLAQKASIPEVEVVSARAQVSRIKVPQAFSLGMDPRDEDAKQTFEFQAWVRLYFVPTSEEAVVIPFHRCSWNWSCDGATQSPFVPFALVPVQADRANSLEAHVRSAIRFTSSDLTLYGPGMATWEIRRIGKSPRPESDLSFSLDLRMVGAEEGLRLVVDLEGQRPVGQTATQFNMIRATISPSSSNALEPM